MDNANTCCFTGHRNLPAKQMERMILRLDKAIDGLISRGVTTFISGGALGFDQVAASLIAAKREMGRNIRLVFALPCKNQDAQWNAKQKALYKALLSEADEVVYVSAAYDALCMKRRNEYMAAHSAYCICALLYEKSGTGQTVRYAREKGLEIINVAT